MVLYGLLTLAALVFAIQAVRAERLLNSAIWLAGVSAMLAIILYRLGAFQVAVIELSVGAGLVTVLFVFTIGMAGDQYVGSGPVVPRVVTLGLVIVPVLLLAWLTLPLGEDAGSELAPETTVVGSPARPASAEAPIQEVIWEQRGLDVLVQVILIFSGVLGVLGLLAEAKGPLEQPAAEEISAIRERELMALETKALPKEKEPV